MSLRPGNNKKKAQKHQNQFGFKHNKSSMTTRKLLNSPWDFLCQRCLDKLEWRLSYRKYKPLSTPSRCNICDGKTIYKAYRTICETCALSDNKKKCTKCNIEVEEYAKPDPRNNPSVHIKQNAGWFDWVKKWKGKHQRTVFRKINKGVRISYDETLGIIDQDTKEVIIPLETILKGSNEEDKDNISEEDENDNWSDDSAYSDEGEKEGQKSSKGNICDGKEENGKEGVDNERDAKEKGKQNTQFEEDVKEKIYEEIDTTINKK